MKRRLLAVAITTLLALGSLQITAPAQATDYNRCLQFDGTNFAEASRNLIPVSGDYTVELMVYSSDKNLLKYAHYISQGAQPAPFYIGTDPNAKIRLGDNWPDTQYTMQHNRWVHLAVVHYSNNSGNFYVDGNFVRGSGQSYDTSKNGTVTRFGSQFFGNGGEFFTGCLDNIRIWSSVRTSQQIKDNWRLATPKSRAGLIANYTFDNHYGFVDRIRSVNSDNADPGLALTFRNNPFSLPETGSFVSKSIVADCYSSAANQHSNERVPQIDQIVTRNKYLTVAQMNLDNISKNSCVGIDVFIKGSNVPISSTVGVNQGNSDLIYVDTALFACHVNSNNLFLLRPWRADNNSKTVYGNAVSVPGCAGEIPESNSAAIYGNQTISLVGASTASIYPAVLERIKASGLSIPDGSITGSNQKILEQSGCHAKVAIARLQRAENGRWVDAQPAEGWEQKSFCDSAHPLQPFVNANFSDGTILRWYISDNYNWEVFSHPFAFKSSGSSSNNNQGNQPSPQPSSDNSNENNTKPSIAVPFAFSPVIKNNNVIINVSFNKVVSAGTKLILTSGALGYGANNPLVGTISGAKGVLTIPKSKFSNLKSDPEINMQAKTDTDSSAVLKGKVPLNSLKIGAVKAPTTTKKVSKPIAAPKPSVDTTQAIKCYKGSLARTFLANSCPPGWTSKS